MGNIPYEECFVSGYCFSAGTHVQIEVSRGGGCAVDQHIHGKQQLLGALLMLCCDRTYWEVEGTLAKK